MAVAAGLCIAVALVWWPAAWATRFHASGFLQWQHRRPDRPDWVNDRPLERLVAISDRMLSLWPAPVGLGLVGVALAVLAAIG